MTNKKQIQKLDEIIKQLKDIRKELKTFPRLDMAIGGMIYCANMAIRHLEENNLLLRQLTKPKKHEKRTIPIH